MSDQSRASDLHCCFCYKTRADVDTLIQGPDICICGDCIEQCNGIISGPGSTASQPPLGAPADRVDSEKLELRSMWDMDGIFCSFCGKPLRQLKRLVSGPKDITICDECVDYCNEIVAETRGKG